MISEKDASMMQEGVSILVATSNEARIPHVVRAHGAIVDRERDWMTVYIPEVTSQVTIANLRVVPKIAVSFGRPRDYRGLQAKGECLAIRPGTSVDRELVRRYVEAFMDANRPFGIEPALRRWVVWPAMAIEVRIDALFEQTPGQGAGGKVVAVNERGSSE